MGYSQYSSTKKGTVYKHPFLLNEHFNKNKLKKNGTKTDKFTGLVQVKKLRKNLRKTQSEADAGEINLQDINKKFNSKGAFSRMSKVPSFLSTFTSKFNKGLNSNISHLNKYRNTYDSSGFGANYINDNKFNEVSFFL